ncbi:MAG: hypothetical protein QF709_01670 [Candidatus Thalassarchaeum sp.]|nr:hypothetical protein [Candidatus Thalassarchaeum sp.]MEE2606678.1 hypothetical protein [Candidatus Thermoplasmatota archaeon]
MQSSEIIAIVLSVSAVLLLWELLRRMRLKGSAEHESEYSGSARDPDGLMTADEQALEELDGLLREHGTNMDE